MPYTLEPLVYWKLRAALAESQRLTALFLQTQEAATIAQQKLDALIATVGAQCGFDPKAVSFRLHDDSCTLTLEAPPAPGVPNG